MHAYTHKPTRSLWPRSIRSWWIFRNIGVERAVGVQTRTRRTYSNVELSGLIEGIRDFGDTSVMRDPESEDQYTGNTSTLFDQRSSCLLIILNWCSRDHGQVDANDNWYTRNMGYSIHVLRSGVSPSVNYRSVNMHVHDSWKRIFREGNARCLRCKVRRRVFEKSSLCQRARV